MPRINNFAITRQFPGGRNESEKITVFVQLEDGDKPGDSFKEVHSLIMDLDPFGPWSDADVRTATRVLANGEDPRLDVDSPGYMDSATAKRVLADHDEWKRRRNDAIGRLNQLGGTTDPKQSPLVIEQSDVGRR